MEISKENRCFRACDQQNNEHQWQESKHVKYLMGPKIKKICYRIEISYQIEFKIKNNWMKIHPNGKIPPINMPGSGFVYRVCSGTWRGIWFVRTGAWIAGALNPKKDPTNESGTEMNSHRLSKATRVPNGTAAEDPFAQSIELVTKNTPKRIPGMSVEVRIILDFQLIPCIILYSRAETYPLTMPNRT